MTGNDIINHAKLVYSVETFLPINNVISFVNTAREQVNKLQKLTYGEYSFTATANTWRYVLDKSFYEIYRARVDIGNTLVVPLFPSLEGDFPFRDSWTMIPRQYAFIPPDKLTLYPAPDRNYVVYLYGCTTLDFTYTTSNLDAVDVIPDKYLEAISTYVAMKIAMYDQNYEVANLLENEFYNKLRIVK